MGDVKSWTNGGTNGSISRGEADANEIFDGEALAKILPQSGTPPLFSMADEIAKPSPVFKRAILSEVRGKEVAKMGFIQVREMHGRLAGKVAKFCFDNAGRVDVARVEAWHDFLADRENFRGSPYDNFPLLEHMRFQMFCVTGRLMQSSEFVDILEKANGTPVGSHGQAILDATKGTMRPGELILASLFSPHRQRHLPSCTINSWINNMIFNNSEQLAKMFASALANGFFYTLSGYFIKLPSVVDGLITVDLENGGRGRDSAFRDIDSGDQAKADAQVKEWQNDGIVYDSEAGEHKLGLPVRNLNDLCFAGIFQETFGSSRINSNTEYGTMHVLTGLPIGARREDSYSNRLLTLAPDDIPGVMLELQREARVQQGNGANYMRMGYERLGGAHAFNVNIAELLALNRDKMKNGDICSSGDLNWADSLNVDITRLGIKKTAEGFELGQIHSAENQSIKTKFESIRIVRFMVYKTGIRQLSPSIE
jgi:hypothetical protein